MGAALHLADVQEEFVVNTDPELAVFAVFALEEAERGRPFCTRDEGRSKRTA